MHILIMLFTNDKCFKIYYVDKKLKYAISTSSSLFKILKGNNIHSGDIIKIRKVKNKYKVKYEFAI